MKYKSVRRWKAFAQKVCVISTGTFYIVLYKDSGVKSPFGTHLTQICGFASSLANPHTVLG